MGHRPLRFLWVLTLSLLTALSIAKAWNRHSYFAARDADQVAYASQQAAERQAVQAVESQLRPMQAAGASQATILEHLRPCRPMLTLLTRKHPKVAAYEFTESASGARCRLLFSDNLLRFTTWTTRARVPFDDAPWRRFGKAVEWAGTIALGACWFLALAALARGARPKSVATVVLATALVSGVACAQDPRPDGVFRDALQARLALATIVVCALMILFAPGRPHDPMACTHCGYNLTGNMSGICPECGTLAPAAVRRSIELAAPMQTLPAAGRPGP